MAKYEYSKEKREFLESSMIPFAIYQFVDKRVVTLILSDGFLKLFNYTDRAEAYHDMDSNMYKETHPEDVARIADAAFKFATEGGEYNVIYRTKDHSGKRYRIIHSIGQHFMSDTGIRLAQVWYTDEGFCTNSFTSDDEEFNKTLNKAIRKEALLKASYYDFLTGLPSMTYFFELADAGIKRIIKNGGTPVFLFLDLSGMKRFNHKHGFAQGDELLRSFSKLLSKYFSTENCTRFGKDHFAVYTEENDIDEIIHNLFRDWQSSNKNKTLPVRVGIYPHRGGNLDISICCDRAKLACDRLKNTYVSAISYYDSSLQEDIDKRDYIIDNIDRAIEEGWITVYYQPIVRATNGHVCDEEALARWIDPEKGFMSPGDFIPILEETHLIYKLDLYIVEQVIAKIKKMAEEGLHVVPQSINLSRSDFESCDIVSEICMRADKSGISHELLTIEITESIVGSNFDFMKKQVDRFRNLGFRVWMDDFGSGYSSLDVLKSLEFDLIKFDMRFLDQLDTSPNGKVILTELLKMATSLGVDTICEGVETPGHVTFLKESGCSKLQGYYYSKPIPLDGILEKYRAGKQIGFENPEESSYFDTVGKINLYDLSVLETEKGENNKKYFNVLPAAIIEIKDGKAIVSRSNQSFRDFAKNNLGFEITDEYIDYEAASESPLISFFISVVSCLEKGGRIVLDEKLPDGSVVHALARSVAVNPVTDAYAIAVAILTISDEK